MSAGDLARACGADGALAAHRPAGLTLPDGCFVRDQSPMPPAALARCLDPGLSPADWYGLVNDCIFFWTDRGRVERHLGALRDRPQLVLAVDTVELLARHGDRAFVTPFNIGAARRRPAARGLRTLVAVEDWRARGWESEAAPGGRARPASHPPAELVVRRPIPEATELIVGVERR